MGVVHNNHNAPDILGFEIKKKSPKITFGDFSASEYLFTSNKYFINDYNKWDCLDIIMNREEFIMTFGTPNPKKKNRYSWSGTCVPKYDIWNECGQILKISDNDDIYIYYSYSKDKRHIKKKFHKLLKHDNILIAVWLNEKIQNHINRKFSINGFLICKKKGLLYDSICFGTPFNFDHFIKNIKEKNIIFDSGMYVGNRRNYSLFRSLYKNFWYNLIIDEY
jgi:hypothetical protein